MNQFEEDANRYPEIEIKKARRRSGLLLEYHDKNIAPNLDLKILTQLIDKANREFGEGKISHNGHAIYSSRELGGIVLDDLPDFIKNSVYGHGVRGLNTDPIGALTNILITGELKGDWGALKRKDGDVRGGTLTEEDFVLLSNFGEALTENGKLSGLRTVMVGGKYIYAIDLFRKAFPGISFRIPQEITTEVFSRKEEKFKSVNDQIEEIIKKEFGK